MNAKKLLPMIAAAMILTNAPARAFVVIEDPPEQFDDSSVQAAPQPSKPAAPSPQARAMALISRTPDRQVDPASLKILGCWIGNIQCKVASDKGGHLFVINQDGKPYAVPVGVKAEEIAIPLHNAFVDSMLSSQPIASEETQARMLDQKDDGAPHFVNGPKPPLMPVMMATRCVSVNGKQIIVGGAIISELPNWKEELKKSARRRTNGARQRR